MTIREDIYKQLADFRGVFGWYAFTEPYTKTKIPAIEIAVYIKEHPIPIRKPKISEVNSVPNLSPSNYDITTNIIFTGAPDLLQVQISGWTITPVVNHQWAPVDISGNLLNFGCLSYNDIIGYFIEGRFNRNASGAWQRKDPDYYITPRGQQYLSPVIAQFQPQATVVMKKQAFDMVLYLET